MFWPTIMVISVVAVSWWGIGEIVKAGTRYSENSKRIKYGYPTLNGDLPLHVKGRAKDVGYIDMTEQEDDRPGRN